MKNYFLVSCLAIFTLLSCKKDNKKYVTVINEVQTVTVTDSNGSKRTDSTVVFNKTINGKSVVAKNEMKKFEYVYRAFDGTEADVTFTHYPDKSYILIERNKLKIELPQTQANKTTAIFEKDGIKAVTEGNKITITQNGKIFELERKK